MDRLAFCFAHWNFCENRGQILQGFKGYWPMGLADYITSAVPLYQPVYITFLLFWADFCCCVRVVVVLLFTCQRSRFVNSSFPIWNSCFLHNLGCIVRAYSASGICLTRAWWIGSGGSCGFQRDVRDIGKGNARRTCGIRSGSNERPSMDLDASDARFSKQNRQKKFVKIYQNLT